jgi:hypothetical protein
MKPARLVRWVASVAIGILSWLLASSAFAYPWMIRYGETGCASCHTDPSGAGALTAEGRARSELLTRGDEIPIEPSCDPESKVPVSPASRFLWGAFRVPDELRLGGDVRGGYTSSRLDGGPTQRDVVLLRSDLYGDLELDHFRAAASLGYAHTGAFDAAITRMAEDNLVSREHWLGYELGPDRSWLARAGRMALPFGIRTIDHTLWARTATRTTNDDDQSYGVALYASKGLVRGEIMAIAGNFMVRPDDYRERGYSGYIELAPMPTLALGVSSLFTRARRDEVLRVTDYRQAHGAFVRYSPTTPLVVMAEIDALYQSLTQNGHRAGYAGFFQADWEAKQGLHFMLTGEVMNEGAPTEAGSYGVWASAVWFFAPHVDLRLDDVYRKQGLGGVEDLSWFATLHMYL